MICLLVAGALAASLPTDHFTLRWVHSVQRTIWEEDWHAESGSLLLSEARVQGSGAGMEPGPNAILEGGWWHWQPRLAVPELALGRSDAVPDHELCWDGRCRPLGALVGDGPKLPVTVTPCP